MRRFLLRGANVPPEQVPFRDYLAEPPSLRPERGVARPYATVMWR